MDIHLSLGQQGHIPGEKLNGFGAFCLGNAQGEHLRILLQIKVILNDVILKLRLLQSTVLDTLHKGILIVSRPNVFCCG